MTELMSKTRIFVEVENIVEIYGCIAFIRRYIGHFDVAYAMRRTVIVDEFESGDC